MQAPPPTTLDPLTQQKIINDFNRGAQRAFDTGIAFVRIMVIAVAVVVGLAALVIVVFVLVSAQWRRARADAQLQDAGDLPGLSGAS